MRNDPMEDRAVEEPLADERRERRRDAGRILDVEPNRKAAEVRQDVDRVRAVRIEQRERDLPAGRLAALLGGGGGVRLPAPAASGKGDDEDERDPREPDRSAL
jgi:hypothetical protein